MSATPLCISYTLYWKYGLLLGYTFFQPVLSIWATGLLITHPIIDIWKKIEYGFRSTEGKIFIYLGFGNAIALQVILRNEILGSNNVSKVTSTLNQVWLIFVLKGIPIGKSSISKINVACSNTERFSLYYESLHTRNQDIFKIHCIFREPWNIQKTDGKNIPLKHIVLRFGNSSK